MHIKHGIRTTSLNLRFLTSIVLYSLQQVFAFIFVSTPADKTEYALGLLVLFFPLKNKKPERDKSS